MLPGARLYARPHRHRTLSAALAIDRVDRPNHQQLYAGDRARELANRRQLSVPCQKTRVPNVDRLSWPLAVVPPGVGGGWAALMYPMLPAIRDPRLVGAATTRRQGRWISIGIGGSPFRATPERPWPVVSGRSLRLRNRSSRVCNSRSVYSSSALPLPSSHATTSPAWTVASTSTLAYSRLQPGCSFCEMRLESASANEPLILSHGAA